MFTRDELLVIEDALKIADEKYIKLLDESKIIRIKWLHLISKKIMVSSNKW